MKSILTHTDVTYNFNKFNLFFDKDDIEQTYRIYIFRRDNLALRFAITLVAFMYAGFILLDALVSPNHIKELAIIRLLIVSPLLLLSLGLLNTKFFANYRSLAGIAVFVILITGLGHFAMAAVADLPEAYLLGVTSITLYLAYTLCGITFSFNLFCGIILLITYELVAIYLLKMSPVQIVYESVFLVSTNTVGMLAGYIIEKNKRYEFVKSHLIEAQKDEILQQNEEIQQHNEEMTAQATILEQQKQQIELQHQELEAKNQHVSNSINYAKKIQKALLPLKDRIEKNFSEMFVLFRPRDTVSGDFYWFARIAEKVIIVGADCTGHGVPGAFMSMIGMSMLTQIVKEKGVTEPQEILSDLHIGIRVTLRQKNSDSRDGMEAGVCVYDKKTKTIDYAGAMIPLLMCQNNTIEEVKADRHPIGGSQNEEFLDFTKHTFDASQNLVFYLFSDGYKDQFGGAENKKFMAKKFKEMLLEVHALPMKEQETILNQRFDDWRGDNFQVDDVLVIGVRT
jgi:serine phosphatase RsbU (regulator of sigma subunit)